MIRPKSHTLETSKPNYLTLYGILSQSFFFFSFAAHEVLYSSKHINYVAKQRKRTAGTYNDEGEPKCIGLGTFKLNFLSVFCFIWSLVCDKSQLHKRPLALPQSVTVSFRLHMQRGSSLYLPRFFLARLNGLLLVWLSVCLSVRKVEWCGKTILFTLVLPRVRLLQVFALVWSSSS